MDDLLARAQLGGGSAMDPSGVLVTAPEAERMIEQLREYNIEEIGTAAWMEQRDWVEQLNIQAHHNAQTHSDEFVMEALVSFDKVTTLIHELLAIEIWKAKVLPHLKKHLAKKVDSVVYYTVFYHEATLANLLEVTLFHSHAAEAASEDALLELVDWCHRKAIYLNNQGHEDATPPEKTTQEWMNQSPMEQLQEKLTEISFSVGMASLSITRYMTDHAKMAPLGVANRMVNTCDMLMALIPLLDNPPWVRRHKGKTQKFEQNKWATVEKTERLRLTKLDGQVWLSVNNLVVDPVFREKYEFNEFRREQIQTLRRYMNELLFDQLPVLKDLQRTIDELTLGGGAAPQHQSRLLLEAVPEMREAMMSGKDWEAVAKKQKKTVFGEAARDLAKQRIEKLLKSFEFLADMEAGDTPPTHGDTPINVADLPVKLDAKRKNKAGVWVSYSDYSFSINTAKEPESVQLADGEGNSVRGKRYRLCAVPSGLAKALPARGKVSVLHGANTADALLELPAPSTKDSSSEFPAVVWLTVGLLATDGFALQIKLNKNVEISHRDKEDGEWYIYEPVGGAITVLDEAPATPPAAEPSHAVTAKATTSTREERQSGPDELETRNADSIAKAAASGVQTGPQHDSVGGLPEESTLASQTANSIRRFEDANVKASCISSHGDLDLDELD